MYFLHRTDPGPKLLCEKNYASLAQFTMQRPRPFYDFPLAVFATANGGPHSRCVPTGDGKLEGWTYLSACRMSCDGGSSTEGRVSARMRCNVDSGRFPPLQTQYCLALQAVFQLDAAAVDAAHPLGNGVSFSSSRTMCLPSIRPH